MAQTKTLDRAQVHHVAKLASVSLSDAEAETLARQLDDIVRYVEELNTLDTTDVPPTAYVQIEGAAGPSAADAHPFGTRPDEVQPCLTHEQALEGAPKVDQGGFAVPTFVES
jgi:aspartyl-tRNA(Asn)/glutamyl-tRNA(Gln) amidotransferase subunit C